MRTIFSAITASLGLLAGCAAPPPPAPMRETIIDTRLNGTWIVKHAEFAGNPLPVPPGIELQINGNQYYVASVTNRALPTDRGSIAVFSDVPVGLPAQLDVVGEDGPNQGKRFPSIYRFPDASNKREMEMCYDLGGNVRPTRFESIEGTLLLRVTYTKK